MQRINVLNGDKEARRLAKIYGMKTAATNDGHMLALAFSMRGNDSIMAISGGIDRDYDATRPFGKYLEDYSAFLPWNGLTRQETRPFANCAEAHLWLELVSRAKNPRHYYAASFTKRGDLSAPCRNCEQWVFGTFGEVFSPTRHYANHPKQKP